MDDEFRQSPCQSPFLSIDSISVWTTRIFVLWKLRNRRHCIQRMASARFSCMLSSGGENRVFLRDDSARILDGFLTASKALLPKSWQFNLEFR